MSVTPFWGYLRLSSVPQKNAQERKTCASGSSDLTKTYTKAAAFWLDRIAQASENGPLATRHPTRLPPFMRRIATAWLLLIVVGLWGRHSCSPSVAADPNVCPTALLAVEAEPVPLPKDTLPGELSLSHIPLGLEAERPVPKDNPLTEAKVRLGRKLFFDPILSGDGTVSCASCHQPERSFAGGSRFAAGIAGKQTTRNAPSLLNRAYGKAFFWDGRETTLEGQALRPIGCPQEMGASVSSAVERLQAHRDYPAQFKAAFPDGITADNLAKALASFERVLLLGNSRVDLFRHGEIAALNPHELHGLWLYESRGRCWRCHSGPNFSDEEFHNTGVSWAKEPLDLGRFAHSRREVDRGRFKTPTLRGVAATAPYMHDGSLPTLEAVVEFYNQGGGKNPRLDPAMAPLGLSKDDEKDLVAFLRALSEAAGGAQMKETPPRSP
jgi:cytochrome c peroxidase